MKCKPEDSAFAAVATTTGENPVGSEGLTKREYFASEAMAALIAKMPLFDQQGEFGENKISNEVMLTIKKEIAFSAIVYADSLIEELNK